MSSLFQIIMHHQGRASRFNNFHVYMWNLESCSSSSSSSQIMNIQNDAELYRAKAEVRVYCLEQKSRLSRTADSHSYTSSMNDSTVSFCSPAEAASFAAGNLWILGGLVKHRVDASAYGPSLATISGCSPVSARRSSWNAFWFWEWEGRARASRLQIAILNLSMQVGSNLIFVVVVVVTGIPNGFATPDDGQCRLDRNCRAS